MTRGASPADPPEPYDPELREIATHVEWQKQGVWTIIWAPYSRCFLAFARWPVPEGGIVVSAADPDSLYRALRDAEREHGYLQWRHGPRRRSRRPRPAPAEEERAAAVDE
ncbi:hypothetical protein J4H86_01090 [Spiractinospora alimapuensis]|uniref:hypothetical protein n=1 Tax=Spiractinospora alimapuensis TaxID=2820884 RepID=UPI001F3325AE|nr:hypothetical protein [Spiractinospora alimapuensis]QVQ52488.1 hypothetical protein J4H86_01090 [Spiractinospora alimapuensis]